MYVDIVVPILPNPKMEIVMINAWPAPSRARAKNSEPAVLRTVAKPNVDAWHCRELQVMGGTGFEPVTSTV
jgi:hypothetical protein